MNDIRFLAPLRRALGAAREEAQRLGHPYIGTEHMLLGLLRDTSGPIGTSLRNLDIAPDRVRQRIEEVVIPDKDVSNRPDIPYTSRGNRVLELTFEEARRAGASAADTVHLLAALCAEGKGIAAQILLEAGLTTDLAREQCRPPGNAGAP